MRILGTMRLALALAIGLAIAVGSFSALTARAAGQIISVNTTADTVGYDGYCSLREAIAASNDGVNYECIGSLETDRIQFDLGSGLPLIRIGSALPTISQPVNIRGATGGATRVELRGPGSGIGLSVGAGATGTTIRGMFINGFQDGIWSLAANVTIAGNWIGPNSRDGISVNGANTTVGGTNTLEAANPCSGDCNLIKGNARYGLYLNSSGIVAGNFIGTDAMGQVATGSTANGTGIVVTQGTWSIGGTAAGTGNLVSGNAGSGLTLTNCASCTVQGNLIGTNVAGTGKIPNGSHGIRVDINATIGGLSPEAGNLISGNTEDGILIAGHNLQWAESVLVYGNRIGLSSTNGPLGNGSHGIELGNAFSNDDPARSVFIGAPGLAGSANVIAHNKLSGITVGNNSKWIEIRGNSMFSNGDSGNLGLFVFPAANDEIDPPTISGLGPLHGTACASCTVDIYSDSADEGKVYHGAVTADASGNWTFGGAVTGPNVTATATNASHSTSMFSPPLTLPGQGKKADGRIKRGAGALVGNNVYNLTGLNQTKTGSTTRGNTITFGISLQNDGSSDQFKVQATGASTTMYTVRYFRNSIEITSSIVAGTYTTPVLGPGDTFLIKATVRVNSNATTGSGITRLVTISSVGDPNQKDAVKFIGKRS